MAVQSKSAGCEGKRVLLVWIFLEDRVVLAEDPEENDFPAPLYYDAALSVVEKSEERAAAASTTKKLVDTLAAKLDRERRSKPAKE